jgi:hypothetical protein
MLVYCDSYLYYIADYPQDFALDPLTTLLGMPLAVHIFMIEHKANQIDSTKILKF